MAALTTNDADAALDGQKYPSLYSVMYSAFDMLPANVVSDAADWQIGRQECADCIVTAIKSLLRKPAENVYADVMTDQIDVFVVRNGKHRKVATYMP